MHPLTCRRARGRALALALRGRTQRKSGGEMFRRSSPYLVVLMPPAGCHRWCFPGCVAAQCAAVRQGPRSRPGLLPSRAVPALAVNSARLPAPALRIADLSSGLSGPRGGRRTLPASPCRLGTCQSGDITSPERLAGVTSPPFPLLANPAGVATIRTARKARQYHGVIKSLRNWQDCQAPPGWENDGCHRATGCDSLVTCRVIKTPARRPTSPGR